MSEISEMKERMLEEKNKEKSVYILFERYKDDDNEVVGVYDSAKAMAAGLAENLAITCNALNDEDSENITELVASMTAMLIDPNCEDECRYRNSVYTYGIWPVHTAKKAREEEGE